MPTVMWFSGTGRAPDQEPQGGTIREIRPRRSGRGGGPDPLARSGDQVQDRLALREPGSRYSRAVQPLSGAALFLENAIDVLSQRATRAEFEQGFGRRVQVADAQIRVQQQDGGRQVVEQSRVQCLRCHRGSLYIARIQQEREQEARHPGTSARFRLKTHGLTGIAACRPSTRRSMS